MNSLVLAILLAIFGISKLTSAKVLISKPNIKNDVRVKAEKTLVLTHILFRHGARTPMTSELYPTDPYKNYNFYPLKHGDLTRKGKRQEYDLGTSLRQRYDDFLGEYYVSNELDAWSTNYNRTKMSMILTLAGLYPPRGGAVWNRNLNWQPVAYNYRESDNDLVLDWVSCPRYMEELEYVAQLPEVTEEYRPYAETFAYISKHTGLNITRFEEVYSLYFGLDSEKTYGLTLPSWTKNVYPKPIEEIGYRQYSIYTRTTSMKKVAAGYLIKKIIDDTDRKIKNQSDVKLHLYSAHEINIGQLLATLELFEYPHLPTYGSYVLMEIHLINETYGLKIYYQDYKSTFPKLLKLPACEEFCPFDTFKELVQEYIPEDGFCGE